MKVILKEIYKNSRFNTLKVIKLIINIHSNDLNNLHYVAMEKDTPLYILEKLSKNTSSLIREAVGINPNISNSLLLKLSEDKHWSVRYRISYNPKTPISVLEKLSQDENSWVRGKIYDNPTYIKYKQENNL